MELGRVRKVADQYRDARLIVLFGSVARSQAMPWSDADVGVEGLDFWRTLELGAEVGRCLGRESHVVDLSQASEWLCYQVSQEGVVLWEGEKDAWTLFRAEAALRFFDVAPIITRCAEGVRRTFQGNHAMA